jgi:type I restriction enzyme, S subunit
MAQWCDCTLGNLIDVRHGYAFLGEYFGSAGSHIVLTPGNFFDEGGFKEKGDKEKRYTGPIPEGYVLSEGDLIVAMTEQAEGLLGSSAVVPRSGLYLHNQRLGLVRVLDDSKTDKGFVYYLFNSKPVRQQIRASASGVKIRHTAPSRIADVKVSVPPLPLQRRIAGILSAYDELIENSQRRIKILEGMARALYREWFVEFRFPGHEKLPRVASPLGDIPGSWAVKALGEIAVTFRGRSYRSVDLADEGGLPFVNLKCLDREGGFRRSGLKRYTGEYKSTQTAKRGDIVVAVTDMTQERRIVARAALVPTLDKEFGVVSMDLVRIDSKPLVPQAFVYAFLRYSSFADEVKQHANGANVLHLAPERITDFQLAVPPADLMRQFAECFAPISEQIDTLENLSDVLRRTRDLLLPRLLSGHVTLTETAA